MYVRVLKRIKPSKVEYILVNQKVKRFLKVLNKRLVDAEAVAGGSFAKDTWLKGDHDVDVFVLFDDNYCLSDRLEKVLKGCFRKLIRIHGSRDYFQVRKFGLDFEVVPVFRISESEEAKNITDVSILHAKWVIKNTNFKLVDEIRLVKQFCKANRVYGAETFIKGFSGYVLEILTIYYGSFENLIKNACKWKEGMKVDIMNFNTKLNKSKLSPFIVIDPVQKERNASAALSLEVFKGFVTLCQGFVCSKDIKYFFKQRIDLKGHDIVLRFESLKGFKDVVGTKALKVFEFLTQKLEDYSVVDRGFYFSEGLMYFDLKRKRLSEFRRHNGPLVKDKSNASRFKERHSKVYVCKGRLWTKVKREFNDIDSYLKHLLESRYVLERVKRINRKIYK